LSHKCATEEHLHNTKFFNTDTYPIKSGSHDSSGKSLNATINNGTLTHNYEHPMQGRIQEGGGRTPLKLEKIWFFGVKSWFFTRNTPKIFAPPSAIGKNMIFWRKIVIFHTKYPKKFRTSLRSAQVFKCARHPPPNLKSWIRPCNVIHKIW
jgi:hypothetical protein